MQLLQCRGVNCVRCDPSAPDRCLKCQGAADPDPDSAFVPFPTYVDPKTGSCKEVGVFYGCIMQDHDVAVLYGYYMYEAQYSV